jgi:oxygen-dependent protoporphyrinogen oxidase
MPEVVVVGAGIAGLTAAWALAGAGVDVVVLEQGPRTGGVIVTDTVDGFVIDGGPDALLAQKPAGVELCRDIGIAERLVPTLPPRTAFVVRKRRLMAIPEGSYLGLPTRVRPFVTTPLFSWPAKVRMALEPFVSAKQTDDDESIGGFIARRFGNEAREYLAEPLLAGIHAGDVDRLSITELFPRLVEAERSGSVLRSLTRLKASSPPMSAFVSFPNGMRELTTALETALGSNKIRCNSAVATIIERGPFRVALASGDTLDAQAIVVATPAWSTASILARIDSELARLCASIEYASSATAVYALRRDQVRHPLNGTGYVVPYRERRALMAATWVSSKWAQRAPAHHVLLRGFVGGVRDQGVLEQTDEALAAAAFSDLAEMLGISGKPILTRVYRWPRATAQYNVGHLETVRAIDSRLSQLPGVFLTGSGYRGTGIPDCIADARATAARVIAFLRETQTNRAERLEG